MAGFFRTPPRQVEFPDEAAEIRALRDLQRGFFTPFTSALKFHEYAKRMLHPDAVKALQRRAATLRKGLRKYNDDTRLHVAHQLFLDEVRRYYLRNVGPINRLRLPKELGGTELRRKRTTREKRG